MLFVVRGDAVQIPSQDHPVALTANTNGMGVALERRPVPFLHGVSVFSVFRVFVHVQERRV